MSSALVSFSGGILRINGLNASSQTLTTGTSGTDFNISSTSSTHTFNIPTASSTNRGLLSSTDWSTFNSKQNAITLTTTGSSGSSTLVGATLNIPTYTLAGLGGVPTSRTLTINGTAYDLSADRSWTIASVVNWSETFSSATQATSQWTPLNAATNVNAAITPKGTGALVAAIPDGTATGGNARGAYAVDWQTSRGAANQVASGTQSVLVGGSTNRVTAQFGFSGGGYNNLNQSYAGVITGGDSNTTANNNYSTIGGGSSNSISGGINNGILSGSSHTVSASYGTIGGGRSNTVSGQNGVVSGGYSCQVLNTNGAVLGGISNIAGGIAGLAVGGQENISRGTYDIIVGGYRNETGYTGTGNESHRFIGGGESNVIGIYQNDHTTIVAGSGNTIYGFTAYAFIGAGRLNNVCGVSSVIGGGDTNRIGNGAASLGNRSTYCFIGGGQTNVVDTNSDYSSVVGGLSNQISGVDYAFIGGGYQGVATLQGQQVYSGGAFSTAGDAQAHELIWRRLITGTAQTELFLDGASIAAILPSTNCLWQGTIEIASICTVVGNGTTTLGDAQGTTYKVTIKRLNTNTTLVGTVQEIGTMNADPSALGTFTIDANDTNESLRIQFTPPASAGSTTVHRVVATFRGIQIKY